MEGSRTRSTPTPESRGPGAEPYTRRVKAVRPYVVFALWVVATAAVIALLASAGSSFTASRRAALSGITFALCAAGAAVAFVRHRDSGDSHPLFVSAGLAVIAANELVFGLFVPLTTDVDVLRRTFLPSYLGLAVWLVAGICFLLGLSLWDRRGRRPIRWVSVFAAAAIATTLLDVALVAGRQDLGRLDPSGVLGLVPNARALGIEGWLMALPAAIALLVAGARESAASRGPQSPHPWLAGAFVVAAGVVLLDLAYPVRALPVFTPADWLPPAVGALALVGLLVHQRADVSKMRRETDRAREITGGRAEIAQMVAHEVRGPVATIRGLASTTRRRYDQLSDPERREFLRMIEEESSRLQHIADQTSTALKVDADTLEYHLRPADLSEVVREGIGAADRADHPLTVEAEPGTTVSVDSIRFAEAVRQLVDNAAKFSPAGTTIEVRASLDGDTAFVEVIDRGPGIAPPDRERIFGKFPGIRPTGYEEVPGAGLGLFICRAHVRAHGCEVVAADAPGGGTMLRITIPLEAVEG